MWQVPWHRVRGSEGQPRDQTLVSHNIATRRGRRHGSRSGVGKEGDSDEDKRSRRARLDGADDVATLTTVERRFKGRRGTRRSTGARDRASSLLPRRARESASDFRTPPLRLSWYEPWSKPGTTNGPSEPGPKTTRFRDKTLVGGRESVGEKEVFLRIVRIRV